MNRREALGMLGISSLTALTSAKLASAQEEGQQQQQQERQQERQQAQQRQRGQGQQAALRSVSECMDACNRSAHRSLMQLEQGRKEYARPLRLLVDNQEVLGSTGKLVARQSPLASYQAEASARACEDCATECEKLTNDQEITECARMCRDTAKQCRMIAAAMGGRRIEGEPVNK